MMRKILVLYLTMGFLFPMFAQTHRILPLGNSITQADKTHYSYRFPLWQKLRNANASFDFIGTMNTNYGGNPAFPDPAFDTDHEGHRGWRADQLLASLPSWLGIYTPDIVLIHVGTNDMFMGNSVIGTVEELKQIIDVLRADNPDVSILLAKIIGTTAPENARIVELNSYMDGIAAAKNTTRSRVIVVDQYTGFNPSTDAFDGKHPNAAGEEKMAQKWFDALMTIMDVESPTTPTGTGLTAEYYNTTDISGSIALRRVEPQVNFTWGYGSPGAAVNTNYFSARWTGSVEPPVSGSYTFSTVSDDGVRLWVNNALVIDNWTDHGSTTNNSPSVALTAGVRCNIRMEYYEKGGAAVARLLWTFPGQAQQIIPQGRLYPSASAGDTQAPTMPASLSASNITQTSFTLSWMASTDDRAVTGYEVFLNGTSNGTISATTKIIGGLSPAKVYTATVRARDAAGNWSAKSNPLSVTTAGGSTGNGLSAYYYNTIDLSGPVVLSRVEQVNFDWRYASPGPPVNTGNFSVRWSGSAKAPVSGNYTFSTISDDGVRLWVNNALVIDNWTDHGSTINNSPPITLTQGMRYAIRMEYYEKGGVAVARLHWTYPGQTRHAIPVIYLYPDVAEASAARMSTTMQFSSDGEMVSSITAEEVSQQLHGIAVYPNPAHADGIRIAFYSEVNEMGDISVFPAHGASVVRLRKPLVEGYNEVEIPTSDLHDGLYLVRVTNRSRRLVARFVVSK